MVGQVEALRRAEGDMEGRFRASVILLFIFLVVFFVFSEMSEPGLRKINEPFYRHCYVGAAATLYRRVLRLRTYILSANHMKANQGMAVVLLQPGISAHHFPSSQNAQFSSPPTKSESTCLHTLILIDNLNTVSNEGQLSVNSTN